MRSAIKIKNTSKSHVAFKVCFFLSKCFFNYQNVLRFVCVLTLVAPLQFQTTAPKSCFMRPPGAILSPGETIIATGNCFFFSFILVLLDDAIREMSVEECACDSISLPCC